MYTPLCYANTQLNGSIWNFNIPTVKQEVNIFMKYVNCVVKFPCDVSI